ncbi:unnamed protein product [Trifolium pratense]|uniref:Uncharacterized protein n=1 Tax=Trifolium pratense TaxID=57577 RepID=A0ACB0I8R0_TRIPR|nr:unnamed protein product [Trifolium pratense]
MGCYQPFSPSIWYVCGGTVLIDFWANFGCRIEPNLSRAGHVTKIIVMWTTNSSQVKLMHCCVVWLAIDIVVSMVDAYIAHYCEMTLERNLFFFKEWILDKSANTYYNFIAANWCTTHFIAHIPFTQDFHFIKSIFSKILNWRFVNGLSFESFVVTFGLTNLAKVCDYNCSSTLIAHSFSYLINGYLLQIYAKSVIMLLKVLIGKHSMERIKGIIASCYKPIMQNQQGGSTTNIGGVAYFFISKKVFTQNAKEANYILEERLWYKLGFIIEYHFDGAACFVSALVQELEKFGDACLFHEKQFIQWDPGGCFIVHVEVATIILHHFLDFNLEDKVCLHRGDSDMIHVVWIPCVLAWMIDNEGTINDIKAVEIMEKIKHKKIGRLQYCFIVLDGSLVAKLVAFGVTKIVTYGCQFMHIIVRICGCTSQVKMERRKKWDPGRHSNMHTTTWSTKFKQWDPSKIGVVTCEQLLQP